MIFAFSDFTLDTDRIELRRQGAPVKIRAKPFDVLVYLLRNHHRAVSKQELFEEIWPDVVVGDATINSCIKQIRQALGDAGDEQRVILTLRGRGYRVMEKVEVRAEPNEGKKASGSDNGAGPVSATSASTPELGQASETPRVSADRASIPVPSPGERKLATVLACGPSHAEHWFEELDAERRHAVVQGLLERMDPIVRRYGGTAYRSIEAGVLVLFGAPRALEDHARRALLAANEILRELSSTDNLGFPERTTAGFAVGLDTGHIVISETALERLAATSVDGVLENAVSLQRHAEPGAIVLGERTEQRVRDLAVVEARESRPGSFVVTWMQPYCEMGSRQALCRFVGRGPDLAALRACLDQAASGRGQAVGVVGEPGLGKSRLLHELRLGLTDRDMTVLCGRCFPYRNQTPYSCILEALRHHWSIQEWDQDPETADCRIRDGLASAGLDTEIDGPILRELLGVGPRSQELADLGPQARKRRCFDLLRHWLERLCERQPVLLEIEDLQWIDPTSEEWLGSVIERMARMRLMALLSFRPGYSPPWMGKPYAAQIALQPLPDQDAEQIARQVMEQKDPDPYLLVKILRKAEGNPFFIEELARSSNESGDAARLPDTIEAVLAARIDRLSKSTKHLLQVAAIVGRVAPDAWLETICGSGDDGLSSALAELASADLLVPAGMLSRVFPHALIQDAALNALFDTERRQLHRRVAEALEAEFPETAYAQPEILAHHFTEAGLDERAVPYWHRAGKQAEARGSFVEAIARLDAGLASLRRLPENPERDEQEMALQTSLGATWTVLKGLAAPALQEALSRLRELAPRVRSLPRPSVELMSLFTQRKLTQAKRRAKELLAELRVRNDEASLVEVYFSEGVVLFHLGEVHDAFHSLEKVCTLYDPDRHYETAFFLGIDPAAHSLSYAGLAQFVLGYHDQGRRKTEQAIALAEEHGSPMSMAAMHHFHLSALCHLRELESALALTAITIPFQERHGIATFLPGALIHRAYALSLARRDPSLLPEMRQHWRTWCARNGATGAVVLAALVVEAHHELDHNDEGLRIFAEAMQLSEQTEELFMIPELLRLKGELLLARVEPDKAEAEKCFLRSLDQARQAQARFIELRAAMSLCRLLQSQGKPQEGRRLLEPVYQWFTEGLDATDPRAAKALLASLDGGD